MYSYQDLLEKEGDKSRMDFVLDVIRTHKQTELYKTAEIADEYLKHKNRTIMQYQKLLYTVSGKAVPDNWSANYKLASGFFKRFVAQETQFLLGNGASWKKEDTVKKLGDDFDTKLQDAGEKAIAHGVSYGFYNKDHVEVFSVLEFAPLVDEENGALCAGVRYWQVSKTKPLRATLYEIDGYTDYMWREGIGEIIHPKRAYKINVSYTEADGETIYDGENYPTFPIVPFWGNKEHQSEIIGLREQIDAYDLIKSGFANDLDDASMIYWTIQNAGGMDDIDLAQFIYRMKTVKAASLQDGEQAQAHTMEIPYAARETILERLRSDMYSDFRAVDTDKIAGGVITATQIRAAYDPLVSKTDEFAFCVLDFVNAITELAGVDDEPTFTRSYIMNQSEEIQNLMVLAEILPKDYVVKKALTILGDGDHVDEVLEQLAEQEAEQRQLAMAMTGGGGPADVTEEEDET